MEAFLFHFTLRPVFNKLGHYWSYLIQPDRTGRESKIQKHMSFQISQYPPISIFKKLRPRDSTVVLLFFLILSGCAVLTAVPVTIKEVKDYVVGRDQSFSFPLDQVLKSSVQNLRKMGFTISRIESFNQKGLVQADWEMTSVKLSMETITPKLTKVIVKVKSDNTSREYSSEDELFANIRETLKEEKEIDWKGLVKGMITVHLKPDKSSPVVAYLAPGTLADVFDQEGSWVKIGLMDNCTGFIDNKHLD
jgi:hypothetical protein